MSRLVIEGLRVGIEGREILRGVDLEVASGEVHAVMGPNGAGKSTLGKALLGHPSYEVLGGSVELDGTDLLSLSTAARAEAGLLLVQQDPVEVPGVRLSSVLEELATLGPANAPRVPFPLYETARSLGIAEEMLERGLNVDASGGEKKRLETLQVLLLRPLFAVLDELDSGLDIDALRELARAIDHAAHGESETERLGVLAITHYRRLLVELRPDAVHVLVGGRIVETGGPDLATELDESGYATYAEASS